MSNMPETRQSLILQIQDPANRDAWEAFAELYRPIVYRLARRRGLQDADAEDLAQQVLVSIARAVPEWQRRPQTRFRHWLNRIARNAIINALTRRRHDAAVGGSDFMRSVHRLSEPSSDLESQIENEYERQIYRRAAQIVRESVNEDTWLAFFFTIVQGESTEAVATRLGKTIGNVHAARSRLMRRLQKTVRELMEADE